MSRVFNNYITEKRMNNTTWVWLVVVAVAIVIGAWFLLSGSRAQDAEKLPMDVGTTGVYTTDMAPIAESVTYDGSSFSPSVVVIKKGGTVTFANKSGSNMWIASAVHPTHTVYSGTGISDHCPDAQDVAFDQCGGETEDFAFTFQKAGTWGYHDHLSASATGRITVVE